MASASRCIVLDIGHKAHTHVSVTLLDVVVLEGAAILKLLSGEDETLLVRRDSFLILDLGLHSLDSVGTLNLKGDCLPRQGLDEDL